MFGKAVSISALTVLSRIVFLAWGAPTDYYPSVIATVSAETPADSGVIYAENGGLNEIGALPGYGYDNTGLTLQNEQQNSHQQIQNQEILQASNGDPKDAHGLSQKYYAYVVEHDDENQEQIIANGANAESPKQTGPHPQLIEINPEWFINNDISTISVLHASTQPSTENPTIVAVTQSESKTDATPKSGNKNQEQFSYRYLHEIALNHAKGVEIVYSNPEESRTATPNLGEQKENEQYTHEVTGSPEESQNNNQNNYEYQIITVQSHSQPTINEDSQKQTEENNVNEPNAVSGQTSSEPQLVVSTEKVAPHNETVTEKTTPKSYVPFVKVEFHVGNHKYNWGSSPTVEPVPFFATAKINEDRSANSTKEKC